ncbi:hypothetical protein FZC74_14325 [Sutcliffiella horikoshii]|uniref:Uncharacterized protein n=1 Tax=Sutcliffiella horikoshii TaxID=79883 RepID=A0AA95B5H3_9BACI|nr:hypothetical protein [Sutcliffiella horikoshii]TYS58161.1 hypothetical protein FZC74_14325 [Sutcliffiella horikoshii]
MNYPRIMNGSQIGTAWFGTHIVLIKCNYMTNQVVAVFKSDHAPFEPTSSSCAETLSRYLSIGYTLIGAYPLDNEQIQYVLQYR